MSKQMFFQLAKNQRINYLNRITANFSSSSSSSKNIYKTLSVKVPSPYVYQVELNRPDKLNSFSRQMWLDIQTCFENIHDDADCRVVILSGSGKLFTAGLDFNAMMELGSKLNEQEDIARKCKVMEKNIKEFQDAITSLEKCSKPIIAAVHNACIGAGIDLISATDIRLCTLDAWFQVKEVAIGMAADVGTLQRFPKVIGNQSLVNELCFTARKFDSKEAKEMGFISRSYEDKNKMIEGALSLAQNIASKSPVAVQVTKQNLIYSRDHTPQEGLDHIRAFNMSLLQSEDFLNATMAVATKGPDPEFSKY